AARDRRVELGVGTAGLLGALDLDDGTWLAATSVAEALRSELVGFSGRWHAADPLAAAPSVDVARQRLGLPTGALVGGLVHPPLAVRQGRVVDVRRDGVDPLTPAVRASVTAVLADLADRPFVAPEAHRLRELGLGPRELAVAEHGDALVRVAEGLVLAPGAVEAAAAALRGVDGPITPAAARAAWGTTRRVAIPLLELLDERRLTRRGPDGSRTLLT
ncbi:SelB domain-containing protein, partial [Angustibacter aerolatus]